MGTQLEQGKTEFRIRAADKAGALVAVKGLAARTDEMEGFSGGKRHFSFVRTKGFEQADTLEDALEVWLWAAATDDAADIVNLEFTGEKVGEVDSLFTALAPFVQSGSYIEALAEGQPFRWRFENGLCHSDAGHVEYDAGPSPRHALENIHALLYADGPGTAWNADTLDAIAEEVAKVIPRPVEGASP